MVAKLFCSLFLLVAFSANATPRIERCAGGVAAFKETLHPLLRQKCIGCHDNGGIGPPHSLADTEKSYSRILPYVNWAQPGNSLIVDKVARKHWLEHGLEDIDVQSSEIVALLKDWWEKGQSTCPSVGKYVTSPVTLPNLAEGVTLVRVPLRSIHPDFRGAELELEASTIVGRNSRRLYLFRRPRLFTTEKAIRLANIKLLLNGALVPGANNFTLVDAVISPSATVTYPLLSTYSVIVPPEKGVGDELALSFEVLETTAPRTCRAMVEFRTRVLPVVERRACYLCHGGGPSQLPGTAPANEVLGMNVAEDVLCRSLLERANGKYLGDSPLIALPLKGALGHPRVIGSPDEIFPGWTDWLNSEFHDPVKYSPKR